MAPPLFRFPVVYLSGLVVASHYTGAVCPQTTPAAWTDSKVIERDVAIIGGGASGSYSAVRLKEDYNLSVVVVEKDNILVSSLPPHPLPPSLTSDRNV